MNTLLKRLAVVLFAYASASLITGYAMHGFGIGAGDVKFLHDARNKPFEFGLTLAFFVALFASVPAGIVIALAERFSWRMPWLYAVAGGLIGLTLGAMFSPPRWFPWFGLCFGPVSGLIYWAIAGRRAGLAVAWQRKTLAALALVPAALLLLSFVPLSIRRLLN